MDNPFAAIESALNGVSVAAFGNATLAWDGHVASGVFSRDYADPLGMVNNQPNFRCLAEDFPDIAAGETVSVEYQAALVEYTVRGVEPDGTGLLRLVMEAA